MNTTIFLAVASMVFLLSPELFAGASMDATVAMGLGDSSSVNFYRMDLNYSKNAGKSKAQVKLNLRDPYAPPTNENTLVPALEDAWVQYAFSRKVNFKIGYEDAYWAYDGRNTELWTGYRLDRAQDFAKIGINGNIGGGMSYGVLFWGEGGEGSSFTDNMAFKGTYVTRGITAGAIFRQQSSGGVELSGNAFFGSYRSGKIRAFGKMASLLKSEGDVGGEIFVIGGSYTISWEYTAQVAMTTYTPVNSAAELSVTDAILWKTLGRGMRGFVQYIAIDDGTVEGQSQIAVGAKVNL